MSFKEDIADDLDRVFFEADEFAVDILYNENQEPIRAIKEEVEQNHFSMKSAGFLNNDRDGLTKYDLKIMVKKSDIEEPFEGQDVTIDGDMYRIEKTGEDMGMYTIELIKYHS